MAIETIKEKMTLRLELDGGVVAGKQKVDSKSFTQIKTTALDDALYGTATTIAGLQEKNLLKVKRIETVNLVQE